MRDTSVKGDRGESIDPMEPVPSDEFEGDVSYKGDRSYLIASMVLLPSFRF